MAFYSPRNIGPADQILFDSDGNAVGIQPAASSSPPVLGFNPAKHAAISAVVSGAGKPTLALLPTGDTSGASDLAMLIDAYQRTSETGEVLLLGPGDWWLNGLPTITQPVYTTTTYGKLGVMTRGYGAGITRVRQLSGGVPCFAAPSGTMMVNFEDMSLIGPELWGSDSVGIYYGRDASTGSHHLLKNLEIRGFLSGLRTWQCAFFTAQNCMVWKNARGYELGNNTDGLHIQGGRVSNNITRGGVSGAGLYLGWKDASHSPGVVTENNRIQVDGGIKFGRNDVAFDFSDYWSGPAKISAYFEDETKIAWLGDGVTTTSFSKLIEFDHCYFTVLSANTQIEARNPTTAVGSIAIRRCRTDASDIAGGFLKVGPSIAVDWQDNQLPSTLFQVQQSATQNITNLGSNTHYRYGFDSRAEVDCTTGGNNVSSTATMTIATPAVITCTDHKCVPGSVVKFSTTGALPTGIVAGTYYRVVKDSGYTSSAMRLEDIATGALINTSGSQSGVHTMTRTRPMRSALAHSGTNQVMETWTRNGSDGVEIGQLPASISDLDGKWVLYNGLVRIGDPITALPTASANYRRVMAYQTGGSGVADTVKCCMKNAADAYTWTTVATGT